MTIAGSAPTPDLKTDPVYWAHHYWREQDFEGDETPFLIFSSLLRYQRMAVESVESELRPHQLKLTDYLLLMTLQLSKSGTRLISSLAKNLLIHATTATLATDRLEGRGLVERSPHPTDRRATCVTITSSGRELARSASTSLSSMKFGLGDGSPEAMMQLGLALTVLRAAVGDSDSTP
jgi:DNA-binding MarR family transcriptional regulator